MCVCVFWTLVQLSLQISFRYSSTAVTPSFWTLPLCLVVIVQLCPPFELPAKTLLSFSQHPYEKIRTWQGHVEKVSQANT